MDRSAVTFLADAVIRVAAKSSVQGDVKVTKETINSLKRTAVQPQKNIITLNQITQELAYCPAPGDLGVCTLYYVRFSCLSCMSTVVR